MSHMEVLMNRAFYLCCRIASYISNALLGISHMHTIMHAFLTVLARDASIIPRSACKNLFLLPLEGNQICQAERHARDAFPK